MATTATSLLIEALPSGTGSRAQFYAGYKEVITFGHYQEVWIKLHDLEVKASAFSCSFDKPLTVFKETQIHTWKWIKYSVITNTA